jgi:ribonuclease HI
MELQAAIKGLEAVPDGSVPIVVTDSSYVRNGVTKWAGAWKRNGWRLSGGGAVKNRDLWEILVDLSERKGAQWEWVKAHSGDAMNEAVDTQARKMALHLHHGHVSE